jgi:TetR/AcrR family transcriptional repressor of nem operon
MDKNDSKIENRTRKIILREAYRQLCTYGYRGTNADIVAARVGLTKGALYYYFRSKKNLALAVIDDIVVTEIEKLWLIPLRHARDPLGMLQKIVKTTANGARQRAGMVRLMLELVAMGRPFKKRLQEINDSIIYAIADSLRQGRKEGLVKPKPDISYIAENILSQLVGGIVISQMSPNEEPARNFQHGLTEYIESLRKK